MIEIIKNKKGWAGELVIKANNEVFILKDVGGGLEIKTEPERALFSKVLTEIIFICGKEETRKERIEYHEKALRELKK